MAGVDDSGCGWMEGSWAWVAVALSSRARDGEKGK